MRLSNQSFYISGRFVAASFIFVLIAMYFAANLSKVIWGQNNMMYLIALPLAIIIVYLLLSIKFKSRFQIHLPPAWGIVFYISIGLYIISCVYSYKYISSDHFLDWTVQRTAFLLNILFIYLAYLATYYYPKETYKALILACKIGIGLTAISFILYLISIKTGILPDQFIIYYRTSDLLPRFAGLFKEPAEASFFLIFSAIVLFSVRSYLFSFLSLLMGFFLFSNSFWLLLFGALSLYIGLKYLRRGVIILLLSVIVATVVFFIVIKPEPGYFLWLDLILPRASNLYTIDDQPQRLWTNWIAIQDFVQFRWPLGGGAGFIRTYGESYYLFAREASHGAGAGVFKFLSDFGVVGVLLLIAGAIKFHKFLMNYRGRLLFAVAAILCVLFMSIRTGYYNISVWTCFFAIIAYKGKEDDSIRRELD